MFVGEAPGYDEDVSGQGMPMGAWHGVLGLSVAETSQITGALLVFALLVTPAAAAHRITTRPLAGVLLSVALALLVTWVGLGLAYYSIYPVGFYVTSVAFTMYILARIARAAADHPTRLRVGARSARAGA